MKLVIVLFLFTFVLSCKQKDSCEWRTVDELQKLDASKCRPASPNDSMYIYMNHFSAGYNALRKEKGIPMLPGNFEGELFTVNNQVRWHGDVKDVEWAEKHEPYMQQKDIEWKGNKLVYDRSDFTARDPMDSWLNIEYILDTTNGPDAYIFNYWYTDKTLGSDGIAVTKEQADSILKAWKLDQFLQ